jgi:hypothetical protein
MGWKSSTDKDARTLAKLLLEDEAHEWTPTLHAASGWELRRFNPAFQALLRSIPEGRVSREIQPDYPARSLSRIPEDRVVIRRFAGEPDTTAAASLIPNSIRNFQGLDRFSRRQ